MLVSLVPPQTTVSINYIGNTLSVIESHSDAAPSLRITNPFPALLEHATSLDFSRMDPTDHGHLPYVIILVRVLDDWKKSVRSIPLLSIRSESRLIGGRGVTQQCNILQL